MSNDVSNDFTVSGLADGESDEIIRALEAENLLNTVMPEPDWASIPFDPSELPSEQRAVADLYQNNDPRWDFWRYENWGTKNDVFGVEVLSKDESADGTWSLTAAFRTSNGQPTQQWFRAFLKQYPRVQVVNIYIDEDRYHGVTVAKDGKTADEARGSEVEEQLREEFWRQIKSEPSGDEEEDALKYISAWSEKRHDMLKESLQGLPDRLFEQIDNRPNLTEFFKQKLAEKGLPQGD